MHCVQIVTHYLVKWKSLPYEDSTWELQVEPQYELPYWRVIKHMRLYFPQQENMRLYVRCA